MYRKVGSDWLQNQVGVAGILRGYDAVHLATALNAHRQLIAHKRPGLTFLSADDRLNQAAIAEGMAVDNPNYH